MKMSLIIFLFLSSFVFICNGFSVLGHSGPLAVQPGGSVRLPCFVQTPIPVEELEVEWRRTDSETVVHLFQDGESQPESQDQAYHDRAHFFTEEIIHGNFSLLLTDVTSKDTGVYKCVVYRNQESNETLIEIKMSEYLTVSGGNVVSTYVGEDTTLNCSVHSHIPPEELQQVSWKKMDQNIILLLFVQGEIQPESTHDKYRDRVELFNPEEIHKGNLSIKLTNVQTGDKGLYICEVLNGALSANTTVEILQLGLSSMHIAVLFLCACVCFCGTSLLLVCIPCSCIKLDDNHMIKIQYALVFCPNVVIFIAYILWGQTEGFFSEVAVCSAINLTRILRLLYYSPFTSFGIKLLSSLEGFVMLAVVYSVMWHVWGTEYKIMLAVVGAIALFIIIIFSLAFCLGVKLTDDLAHCLDLLLRISRGFLFGITLISVFFIVNWRGDEKDKMGLIFDNVLLFILTVLVYAEFWFTGSGRQPGALIFKLCMCAAAVLFLMNSITLSAELILSARNGKRTIEDLQVVLLPFEWVIAIGYITAIFGVELSEQKAKKVHKEENEEEELNATQLNRVEDSVPQDPAEGGHMTDS